MKKLIILSMLGIMGFLAQPAAAQISLNINIGSQPLWGPVGYDHVDYYYLPDVESYYSVSKQQFIYQERGKWIFSRSLPARYRNYDLYNGYKVVVNSRDPYRNFDRDRLQYARYKNVRTQQVIRNSNDKRYYVVKGHPHGMPPGQAKKYPGRVERPQVRDNGRGNERDNRGNDQNKRGNEREKRGNDNGRGR